MPIQRFHANFTPISHRLQRIFLFLSHQEGEPLKGGNDYVFRFGMVLVACYSGGAGNRYPVQGQVYKVMEQAGAGKEKGAAREMGG